MIYGISGTGKIFSKRNTSNFNVKMVIYSNKCSVNHQLLKRTFGINDGIENKIGHLQKSKWYCLLMKLADAS